MLDVSKNEVWEKKLIYNKFMTFRHCQFSLFYFPPFHFHSYAHHKTQFNIWWYGDHKLCRREIESYRMKNQIHNLIFLCTFITFIYILKHRYNLFFSKYILWKKTRPCPFNLRHDVNKMNTCYWAITTGSTQIQPNRSWQIHTHYTISWVQP